MQYKELKIRGISHSQSKAGAYALLLEEMESGIKLPIVIGNSEAQSISLGLQRDLQPPRPMTHDLFTGFITQTGHEVASVIIYQLVDGVFYSNINITNALTSESLLLDARTSDAVALAVRFNAPIYTTSAVLDEAGIIMEIQEGGPEDMEDDEGEQGSAHPDSLPLQPTEILKTMLDEAVKSEDYDLALRIQEVLKTREKKID